MYTFKEIYTSEFERKKTMYTYQSMKSKLQPKVLRLKITLKHMKPPVWRRIEVHSTATFHDLHYHIQACMPWSGGHLHSFEKYNNRNGMHREWLVEDRELSEEQGLEFLDEDSTEERTTRIMNHLKHAGDTCTYCYDFGDGWEHEIKLEKINVPEHGVQYPRCTKTKGICPFEDCGGPWGWEEKLRILQDPKHPEYGDIREWLGLESDDELILTDYAMSPEDASEAMRNPEWYTT